MLEHVRTLYTPRTSTQNTYSARIFVVYLWLQDFEVLDCLLVDSSESATRVSGKESDRGTGGSVKGTDGNTDLTWNQNLEPSPCVRVWGSSRRTMIGVGWSAKVFIWLKVLQTILELLVLIKSETQLHNGINKREDNIKNIWFLLTNKRKAVWISKTN